MNTERIEEVMIELTDLYEQLQLLECRLEEDTEEIDKLDPIYQKIEEEIWLLEHELNLLQE